MRCKAILWATLALLLLAQTGCAEVSKKMQPTWHERFGWKAEEYFDDPQVVALCRAIEANDIARIDRLVAAGADVKAEGKGKMTPLLWAFPDNKLERFRRLLEHGADPNVIVESDFGTSSAVMPGESVTHMVTETSFPGYFEAVFRHGGNPNLAKQTLALGKGDTPIFGLIKGQAANKLAKAKTLIGKGADLNHLNGSGTTPTMSAVGRGGQFDIALLLLEAGADPGIYQSNEAQKLTHVMVRQESGHLKYATPQQKADYQKIVNWLVKHGESLDEARADLKRWASWSNTTGEFRRNLDAEIAARKAREARDGASSKPNNGKKK